METDKRRSVRLMSSLMDLKLTGPSKYGEGMGMEGKQLPVRTRTNKKIMTIKGPTDDTTIHENFERVDRSLTEVDEQLVRKCLSTHFLFSSIVKDEGIMQYLLRSFFCCEVKQGSCIIKQGDNASSFFVLQKGRLEVIINGESKRQICPEEGFGELALLYNAPRSASLRALENCRLWGIDRTTFKKAVTQASEKQYEENRKFIEKFKFFEYLNSKQKEGIAGQLILQKYEKGDRVVRQGDPADSFYIVKTGKLRMIEQGNKVVGHLNAGDYFGENALLSDSGLRRWTVEAEEQCYLLALGREVLTQLLGKNLQAVVVRNKILAVLQSSPIFGALSSLLLERIIDALHIEKLPEGGTIVKANDHYRDRMFFILEGTPKLEGHNGEDMSKYRHTFFGERGVLCENAKSMYSSTMKFEHCGVIAHITYTQLMQVMGGTYEDALNKQKNAKSKHKQDKDSGNSFKHQSEQLTLDRLYSVKNLGHGQFGRVYLVTNETRSCEYALKCIEKSMILESRLEKHLQNEKLVLEQINNPFLIQYGRSFKDANYVYFLTEHINGMELFDVIRQIGLLSSRDTSLYIAQMLQALDYLHRNNIIYRDLKPQNVMVDKDGYLKLIDMGTCKIMSTKATLPKTFTIIGTPHYMSPEVLSGKGYTYHADLWSLGVCMYEFMVGQVPFGDQAEDPFEIYAEIIEKEITFPKFITDEKAKAMMKQLLSKIPETRLGGSFASLYNHPWLAQIEWEMLLARKLKMPYLIPTNKLINTKALFADRRLPRIQDELATTVVHKSTRKDVQADWDRCF